MRAMVRASSSVKAYTSVSTAQHAAMDVALVMATLGHDSMMARMCSGDRPTWPRRRRETVEVRELR